MSSEAPTNLPPNHLGRLLEKAGNWSEKNATALVVAVSVLLVGAAGYTWWHRQQVASATAAWTLLEAADDVGDFASVAETHQGTTAGDWAKLRAAELNFKTGADSMFTNRETAIQELKRAREDFSQLLSNPKTELQIRERAAWGMARALEVVCDGDTSKPIEAYERLIADFPETIYKAIAEERIKSLKTGGVKEFYAWFSKQNPKPADIRPKDGGMTKEEIDDLFPSPKPKDGDSAKDPKTSDDAVKPETPKPDEGEGKKEPEVKPEEKAAPEKKPEPTSDEKKEEKPAEPAKPETPDAKKDESVQETKPEQKSDNSKPEDK